MAASRHAGGLATTLAAAMTTAPAIIDRACMVMWMKEARLRKGSDDADDGGIEPN